MVFTWDKEQGSPVTNHWSSKLFAIVFLIISLLGFIDATFLSVKHFTGGHLTCSIFSGCNIVANSQFSQIFGVPVALLGALYYFTVFILAVAYLDMKKEKILRTISLLTPIGLLASLWFVFLQFFILKAICLYCMMSATTSTLLFICGMIYLNKSKAQNPKQNLIEKK
ncbi:MAG: vitamin K epoxide reductase family protein [Patescibacteria group bacterium]